jgi:hypothetical protein
MFIDIGLFANGAHLIDIILHLLCAFPAYGVTTRKREWLLYLSFEGLVADSATFIYRLREGEGKLILDLVRTVLKLLGQLLLNLTQVVAGSSMAIIG